MNEFYAILKIPKNDSFTEGFRDAPRNSVKNDQMKLIFWI